MNHQSSRGRTWVIAAATVFAALALPFTLLFSADVSAQASNWPNKPVRWINPFPAGGGTDVFARPMAGKIGAADRSSATQNRSAVNAKNPNAYTPEELSKFIQHQKKTGALKRMTERFDLKHAPRGH